MISRFWPVCLITIVCGCTTVAAQPVGGPPTGAAKADVGFPVSGTRWVAKFVSETGVTTTSVYTILEDGIHDAKPVHRMGFGSTISIYDKATANLIATLRNSKETVTYSPHIGTFSWPLYVGKSWIARYTHHDRVRETITDPVQYHYQVEAFEKIVIAAGTWEAFRIQSKSASGTSLSTIWYAPELKLIVKRINETTVGHSSGPTKSTYEIIEYPAKEKAP